MILAEAAEIILKSIKPDNVTRNNAEMIKWAGEPAEIHRVNSTVSESVTTTNAAQLFAPPGGPADTELHLRTILAEQRLCDLQAILAICAASATNGKCKPKPLPGWTRETIARGGVV